MVVFIGASSLSHSIDRYPNIKRRLGRRIKATPGLSFNPQADREKQVRHILRLVPRGEGIILWHDVLNNSITSHPQIKRTPLTPEQLVEKVSSVPNLTGIVYIQREVSKIPLVLCFRIQAISEDPEKSRNENLIPTNEKVNEVLKCLGVNPQVFEMNRLGKFNKDRTKPRTLLVTLATSHEVRLVLAKSVERRNELKLQNVFISQALSKDEAIKESLCLKKRRELLEEGVPREKLTIRNFELFNNEVKVELETGAPATR